MPFKGDPAPVKTETISGTAVEFLPQSATHFADCPQSQQWSRRNRDGETRGFGAAQS